MYVRCLFISCNRNSRNQKYKTKFKLGEMAAFTDLHARNNAGEDVDFSAFAGKVVLAVNVARL